MSIAPDGWSGSPVRPLSIEAFEDPGDTIAASDRMRMRTSLRLSLEPAADHPVLRQGRAIGWIAEALAPLQEAHPHPPNVTRDCPRVVRCWTWPSGC